MKQIPLNPQLAAVINANRKVLTKYGEHYGKRIYTVVRENVDLLYNTKKNEGQPSLIKPLFKFLPKPIDIYDIKLIEADGSGDPCVIINNDVNLKFPVTDPKFSDVTPVTVKEALESDTPIFFADAEKLVKEVNSLNMAEFKKAKELATEFMKQASFLSDLCQKNSLDMTQYLKQLQSSDDTTEVIVNQKVIVEN